VDIQSEERGTLSSLSDISGDSLSPDLPGRSPNHSVLAGRSPNHSVLAGRSPNHSVLPGRSPNHSVLADRSLRPHHAGKLKPSRGDIVDPRDTIQLRPEQINVRFDENEDTASVRLSPHLNSRHMAMLRRQPSPKVSKLLCTIEETPQYNLDQQELLEDQRDDKGGTSKHAALMLWLGILKEQKHL